MSIAAMGELEKRQRQQLREEAVQRRPEEFCYPLDSSVSEGGKGKVEAEEWTAAKERQTPVKGNKRKMVGREEVKAKRRRIDKEAGVAVKCSHEQGKGSEGKGMEERQTPAKTPAKGNKRKMMGREEVEAKRKEIDKEARVVVNVLRNRGKEAKRRRINKEAGVVVKCSHEQGKGGKGSEGKGMDKSRKDLSLTSLKKKKIAVREEAEAKKRFEGEDGAAVTGMDRRKKETSFPWLKRKRIAERDEAEATKRIPLSSSPVCSYTDSCSHDRVCSSNGSSSRGQAAGDAALVSSLHSIGVPRGKRTHLKVS